MRQVAALCIVVALVFAAPVIDAVLVKPAGGGDEDAAREGIAASELMAAESVDEALERLHALAEAAGAPPEWFDRELGMPADARDVRASESVVGYAVDGDAADVAAMLERHLKDRGWSCVPLGRACGFTCMKSSGTCTWALVTCTQVGSTTSVVTRCNTL